MSQTSHPYKYLFGPVPSRRLGKSLGIDLIPFKTCTQNCLYCQLGVDAEQTVERKAYVSIDEVLGELRQRIKDGLDADYITISGSGEPTLHSELGELIEQIRELTLIPIAVITNGTLLMLPEVRRDCAKADVVLPSLDAGEKQTFEKINKPHTDIKFEDFIEGLCKFRAEYSGKIWLEVFFCEGVNADTDSIELIRSQIEKIRPDRIQLNTAVRPTVHKEAAAVSSERLHEIAKQLDPEAEVIADFCKAESLPPKPVTCDDIVTTLKRRPCTLEDLVGSLGITTEQAKKHLKHLLQQKKINQENRIGKIYYTPGKIPH